MSNTVRLADRERETTAPGLHAAHPMVDERDPDAHDPAAELTRAAVFPAPLTTVAAGAIGALIGVVVLYLLVTLRADPLFGVGVIIVLFALALSGPKLLADARTEAGRTVAVVLDGIAFGGTLGGLILLLAT